MKGLVEVGALSVDKRVWYHPGADVLLTLQRVEDPGQRASERRRQIRVADLVQSGLSLEALVEILDAIATARAAVRPKAPPRGGSSRAGSRKPGAGAG